MDEKIGGEKNHHTPPPFPHAHQRRGPAVIKQAQHVDGVQALGGGQQRQGERRDRAR